LFANVVRAITGAKNEAVHPSVYARDVLNDERVAKALSAGGTTAGGYMVPSDMTSEVYKALVAKAVVRRAGAITVGMPVGNLKMPKINTGSAANWIGENENVVKTEPVIGQVALSFKKLAALVPMSNDFLRYSTPSTNGLIQSDVVRALAAKEDVSFIRGASGGSNPIGIANHVAAGQKVAMTATPDLDKITKDLNNCRRRVVAADVDLEKAGWLMSPRTMFYLAGLRNSQGALAFPTIDENGTLHGYPIHMTTQIPENLGAGTNETEIYFVEFTHCIIGEALNISVAVSDQAAYHDGSNVVSAFSQDQTVIRVIEEVDFGLRFDKSGSMITGVTWS
jgi:HK97 family phage major capsid protein